MEATYQERTRAVARVLIIDDDRETMRLLKDHLEREGYQVSSVADPRLALPEVRRFRPDLVLLDVLLPGVDGLEICKQIRRTRDLSLGEREAAIRAWYGEDLNETTVISLLPDNASAIENRG
jgi:CheY-like chemotaxis protein